MTVIVTPAANDLGGCLDPPLSSPSKRRAPYASEGVFSSDSLVSCGEILEQL